MAKLDPEEIRRKVDFDRLITAANVYRVKGDYTKAGESIAAALAIIPDDLDAREFAADILAARGETEKAAEHYKSLYSDEYPRASAEEKYAKMVVQMAEGKRQQQLLLEQVENPAKYRAPGQNPYLAAVISIAPGFGHIYAGLFKKGLGLFAAALVSWLLFYALRTPVDPAASVVKRAQDFFYNMSPWTIVFGLAAVFIQIYAMIDAAVYIDKRNRKKGS